MEKLKTTVSWIASMEAGKRVITMCLITIIVMGSVIKILYGKLEESHQKEIECEQRMANVIKTSDKENYIEKLRTDSILRVSQKETRDALVERINSLDNTKYLIKQSLKK